MNAMKFSASAVTVTLLVCIFVCGAVAFGQSESRLRESADPYFTPDHSEAKPVRGAENRGGLHPSTGARPFTTSSGRKLLAPPATNARPTRTIAAPATSGKFSPLQSPNTSATTPATDNASKGGSFKPLGQSSPNRAPASQPIQTSPNDSLMAPLENDFPESMRSSTPKFSPQQSQEKPNQAGAYVNTPPAERETGATNQENEVSNRQSFGPSRILARVGDQPIFVSDLSVEAMQIVDQHIRQAPMDVKQREARKLMPRLLPKYIQAKLLLVDTLDGLPDEANVDEIFENAGEQFEELMLPLLIKNTGVKNPGELDAYYRALGSSLRTVKQSWAESELVKFMMRKKLNLKPDVSHREIFDDYQANRSTYAIPAKVKWEQLVVRYDRFPSKQAAREAMAKMGDEVVFGAPFAAVAKRSSQGFKASDGGLHDWTTKGSLVDKKLDELLFQIESGKLSEIIETPDGLAIIRVIDRNQAGFIPFAEKQQEIMTKIQNDKREVEFKKYVSKVRNRIPVEIFDTEFLAEAETATRR